MLPGWLAAVLHTGTVLLMLVVIAYQRRVIRKLRKFDKAAMWIVQNRQRLLDEAHARREQILKEAHEREETS